MSFVLSIFALVLSASSVALSALALRSWLHRPSPVRRETGSAAIVAGVPASGCLESATLTAIAASATDGSISLATGRLESDGRTRPALEELRRRFPGFVVMDVVAIPDPRHVLETSLAVSALKESRSSLVLAMSCRARPSARTIRNIATMVPEGWTVSAFPVRRRLGEGLFSASSDVSRLTPVLYSLFGPAGVLSTLTAADRAVAAGVMDDPVSMNRPTAGHALHAASPDWRFVLSREPVSCSDLDVPVHLAALSRISASRVVLVGASLMAGPLSLVSLFAAVAGGCHPATAIVALLLSLTSRAVVASTWPNAVCGARVALVDVLVSPVADAAAFLRLVVAAANPACRSGGALYQMRAGGLMVPDGRAGG